MPFRYANIYSYGEYLDWRLQARRHELGGQPLRAISCWRRGRAELTLLTCSHAEFKTLVARVDQRIAVLEAGAAVSGDWSLELLRESLPALPAAVPTYADVTKQHLVYSSTKQADEAHAAWLAATSRIPTFGNGLGHVNGLPVPPSPSLTRRR
jgi:hypothetical protein